MLPEGTKLAFLGISDPFLLYFKMTGLVALFLASPFVFYQVWMFVAPGLYKKERLHAIPFIIFTTLFFVAGGIFAYFVAYPFAVEFLNRGPFLRVVLEPNILFSTDPSIPIRQSVRMAVFCRFGTVSIRQEKVRPDG